MSGEGTAGHPAGAQTLLDRAPFFVLGLLTVLLPFFFIPSSLVIPAAAKAVLLYVAVALLVIFWVLSVLKRGVISVPRTWVLVALAVVAAVYLVASLFSAQPSVSLIGEGFATETFVSVFAGLLLALLIPSAVRSKRDTLTVYAAVVVGFAVVALVQLIRLFAGPDVLTLSVLFTQTASLLGKWNDLGIFAGLVLLLSVLTLEMLPVGRRMRVLLYIAAAVAVFFLALVQFVSIWYVIGTFFLLLVLYKLSIRAESSGSRAFSRGMVSVLAVTVVILSIIFIIAGEPIEAVLTDYFGTAQVEVRPSWGATFSLAETVLRESPAVGVGPNQFPETWFLHKPVGVNLTAFWGIPFSLGIGFVPTALVTAGILGLASWVAFLLAFLYLGARSVFRAAGNTTSQYLIVSSFLAALYLWIFLVVYTPGLVLLALAFIFTGLFLASLLQARILEEWHFSFSGNAMHNFVGALVSVVLLIVVGVGGYGAVARFVGGVLHQQGIARAQAGEIDAAERSVARALQFSEQASFYRSLAQIQTGQLSALLQRTDLGQDALLNQFQTILASALSNVQRATTIGSESYENWMLLGNIYEEILPLGVDGAYESARGAYESALERNPTGPDVFLSLARLEARRGNFTAARERIAQALSVKQNYTDAIFLLSQIEVTEGNVTNAIRSVEAATLIEPNNPVVFFQLGLLRYSVNDFVGAASAFEAAVALNGVYANARYFLGLSYDRLGRRADAILQFEEVERLNQGNQVIAFILENLRNDRAPFADVQPPLDDEPESRPTLPADEPIIETDDTPTRGVEE